ncbi:hypothetical protein [Paludisphaera borealis]|uniref:Uncharacterized protein n=1 Tax=Paludisphaera borealis TaxID=1387353 RepID=A0A1U7CJV1_9BACT|nr:hypothetical protein [Paludisphaera borealis]APW59211.1 hypothetical protein BSF38_00626 [Paludisphaera borealis]
MTHDPLRPLRLKWDVTRDPGRDRNRLRSPGRDAQNPRGTPRFIGQVASGGAMPNSLDHVFLVHPVRIEGGESEGAASATLVDSGRTIPVVIVGTLLPNIGDFVVAQSIGGRWVAELNGTPASPVACSPCAVPRRNLTVSWTNVLTSGGSALMTFNGSNQWQSGCANQLVLTLACQGGSLVFSATYFPTGGCPNGASQSCATSAAGPYGLAVVQQVCNPFLLSYSASASTCPFLATQGFRQFTITQ